MGCCLSICKKHDDRLPSSSSSSSSLPAAAVIAHRISINEDEGIKAINTTSSPLTRQVNAMKKVTSTSTVTDEALPLLLVRFINYNDLKKLPSFPRYPENADLCINEDAIDRSSSLVIFISHCWLRGWSGAARTLEETSTRYEKSVSAVWIDYGCINQNADPAGELKQLDKIVQACALMLMVVYMLVSIEII